MNVYDLIQEVVSMKHFLFALGLFSISAVVSVLVIYGAARYQMREEAPVPNTVIETESVNEMEPGEHYSGKFPVFSRQ